MIHSIIIGSGIAGIYIALQLLEKNKPFIILEAQNEDSINGRLITYNNTSINDGFKIELGASIFHSKQKNINWIIKKLNLNNDIITYKRSDMYIMLKNKNSEDANLYFKNIEKKLKHFIFNNINEYHLLTLDEASKKILTNIEYNDYKTMHYEWFEHFDKNCNIYFQSLENEGSICSLKNGMESIIDAGHKLLKKYIYYNHTVSIIKEVSNTNFIIQTKGENKSFECNNLFLCTNLNNKITYQLESNTQTILSKKLNWCKPKECIRFYIFLNTDTSSLPNYIVGDHIGKFSIKINNYAWLIAYTDSENAIKCNSIEPRELIRIWFNQINDTFKTNLRLDHLKHFIKVFWNEAYVNLNSSFYKENNKSDLKNDSKNAKINTHFYFTGIPKNNGEDIAWCEANLINITFS
jgi:hypothetical protein